MGDEIENMELEDVEIIDSSSAARGLKRKVTSSGSSAATSSIKGSGFVFPRTSGNHTKEPESESESDSVTGETTSMDVPDTVNEFLLCNRSLERLNLERCWEGLERINGEIISVKENFEAAERSEFCMSKLDEKKAGFSFFWASPISQKSLFPEHIGPKEAFILERDIENPERIKYEEQVKSLYEERAEMAYNVPRFWMKALMTKKKILKITQRDKMVLKFLKNIKYCRFDEGKGFKLEFLFDFGDGEQQFSNSVLTKMLYTTCDLKKKETKLEKTIGTEIDWLVPSFNPTTNAKKSFFNFFKSCPTTNVLPTRKNYQRTCFLRDHYLIGATIREAIIPDAIDLYWIQ